MGDLSAHFSKSEFACHCCGQMKIDNALIVALEHLRALAGSPIVVHDGYRCPEHNQEVGGVSNSEHTRGMAADISISGLSLQQMYELALQIPTFFKGASAPTMPAFSTSTCACTRPAGRAFAASTSGSRAWCTPHPLCWQRSRAHLRLGRSPYRRFPAGSVTHKVQMLSPAPVPAVHSIALNLCVAVT